jgi:hypothetical protein
MVESLLDGLGAVALFDFTNDGRPVLSERTVASGPPQSRDLSVFVVGPGLEPDSSDWHVRAFGADRDFAEAPYGCPGSAPTARGLPVGENHPVWVMPLATRPASIRPWELNLVAPRDRMSGEQGRRHRWRT